MAGVIVVGTNASTNSDHALSVAARLAHSTDNTLVVVHVAHLPGAAVADSVGATTILASLDNTVDQCHIGCELTLATTGVRGTFEVRHGDPARALIDAGAQHGAVCIVVGRHGSRLVADRLLGSVTKRLVFHADRPVLIVPPEVS